MALRSWTQLPMLLQTRLLLKMTSGWRQEQRHSKYSINAKYAKYGEFPIYVRLLETLSLRFSA